MNREQWQKIREIFDEAIRREPEERRRFVIEVCGDDKSLCAEVESLLSSLENADNFLETPVVARVAEIITPTTPMLTPNTTISHYKIIEQIGAGGMGEVYLATDTRLNRKAALKLLATHITEEKNRVSRFRQEAFATSVLNHPNIVTIYDIGKWYNRDFIATEFIEGETLRALLLNKKLSVSESLDIALQIASALKAAHSAGIVHRDIKPENIMIRPDGLVKVLDFGIAKYRPTGKDQKSLVETDIGEIVGTAAYMSPEQARGLEVDSQTDIWSLGVILYEMLARKQPFTGETKSDRIAAILEHEPPPIAGLNRYAPVQIEKIIFRALAKDKNERYATAADLAEELYMLRETTGDKSGAPLILSVRKLSNYRRANLIAIVLMCVLLVGVSLAVYYFFAAPTKKLDVKKSIVVLPLRPINQASRDELYEVGIADSLIQRLSMNKEFIVRPLSEIRKYADIEQDAVVAGREQHVDYVLASYYQIAGGRIRVTSQFLNVETGQTEETYKSEKETNDVFALQDAIADEVGKLLQAHFALTASNSSVKRGTDNEEAYRLYLQAQYLIEKGGAANAKRSMELFDEALKIDPNYAKAWAGKARAHFYFPLVGDRTPEEEYSIAKTALERALALDNSLSEAHAMLGVILNDYEWNFADADKEFARAIELDSDSALAYRWFARRLAGQGRYDEAVVKIKTAIDLNPSSVNEQLIYGRILYFARRYDEAIAELKQVAEINTDQAEVYAYLWRCYHFKSNQQQAYDNFIKFHQLIGTKDEILKQYQAAYAKDGWHGALQSALKVRQAEAANGNGAYDAAMLAAMINQSDQALQYLDDAVKKRAANVSNLRGDPGLDKLRGDPRFAALIKKVESK